MTPRRLGSTSLFVTPIAVGTSALASMPEIYGYAVPEARAIATVSAVLASPINLIDTSNEYGSDGAAERRVGAALRLREAAPGRSGFVVASKVDPTPGTKDFSGDRVRASLAESLERLGLESLDLLFLHDPERITLTEALDPAGSVRALVDVRDRGLVRHIGVAGGPPKLLRQYASLKEFEVVLTHNRYTLLDRTAEDFFAEMAAQGIGVLNAAPFGGGLLARGSGSGRTYAYGSYGQDDLTLTRHVEIMEACCKRHGVPLKAAALQFSMRNPSIDSTVVGVSSPERVAELARLAAVPVPDELWGELDDAAPPAALWIGDG